MQCSLTAISKVEKDNNSWTAGHHT